MAVFSAGAFAAMLGGLQLVGAVRNAIIGVMEPLGVAVLAAFFLDEPITAPTAIGGRPDPRRRDPRHPRPDHAASASRTSSTFGAMTEQLFAEDAYLTSCEATVVDVRDEGVILDRTVFYARGGGQPGDTGTLRWESGLARVTDTVKMGGDIVHQVEGDAPLVGHSVTAEIDWARRHRLMRTHTALHALSGVIFRELRGEGDRREHGRHRLGPDGLRARRDESGARQGGRGRSSTRSSTRTGRCT